MKIYFSGSISGGRNDVGLYADIIEFLKNSGHEILAGEVGNKSITDMGRADLAEEYIYQRDNNWLTESDLIIAEVTTPSHGVGYEIAIAENKNKKVLCLYRQEEGKRLSAMIKGNKNIKVAIYKNFNDIKKIIDDFFINLENYL